MTTETEICTTALKCIYDFQTFSAGILASLAGITVWFAAKMPIEAQRTRDKEIENRRLNYVCLTLAEDFKLLATRAKQAEGTMKAVIAADKDVTDNTKEKTKLKLHPLLNEWGSISLLPAEAILEIAEFRHIVENHNFDMERAGGAFGADNFRETILERVRSIQSVAMRLSNKMHGILGSSKAGG